MILDHIDNCQMYYGVHKDFEKAFGFIQDFLKHPLENGKYEIDGENVFATVSDCELHETGNMEAHNKYIDIQFLVKGREIIKVINRNCLEIKEDLTPGKDVIFYKETICPVQFNTRKILL